MKSAQKKTEYEANNLFKYKYEFLLKKKKPDRGYNRVIYTLLTPHEGQKLTKNKQLLNEALLIAYGHIPRRIRPIK